MERIGYTYGIFTGAFFFRSVTDSDRNDSMITRKDGTYIKVEDTLFISWVIG